MSGDAPEELEVVERYEISDDEDDFEYGTIDDEENLGLDDEDDDDEDLATALADCALAVDASSSSNAFQSIIAPVEGIAQRACSNQADLELVLALYRGVATAAAALSRISSCSRTSACALAYMRSAFSTSPDSVLDAARSLNLRIRSHSRAIWMRS